MTTHRQPRQAGDSAAVSVFTSFTKRVAPRLAVVTAVVVVMFAFGIPASGAFSAGASSQRSISGTGCTVVGTTGLTAKLVTSVGLTGTTVTATGCDVGIYVPPATTTIVIAHVKVSGAKDEGILVQNSTYVTVEDSTVTGNGVDPTPSIAFDNALELVGTSNSTVVGNTVSGNFAGGIGVADDGPTNPGGPKPSTLSPANHDTITNNTISGVYGGCSIVFSSRNPGAGITGGHITGNVLTGDPGHFGPHGPVIGNIVVATAGFGASLSGVTVSRNKVTGAGLPGIIVHADAPKSKVSRVTVTHNTLSGDDWLTTDGPPVPAGIVLASSPIPPPISPVVTTTSISANKVSGEYYDVWSSGAQKNSIGTNTFSTTPGGTQVYSTPVPGSGYWDVASDGGLFAFGTAGFYGSMGGQKLNAPVVGMMPTLDQGGYWEVAADGGIFAFGDAIFYGSMGGKPLNSPVVGLAPTPYVASASPGGTPSPAGKGYWEVAADGGVFAFGDAAFYGSMGGKPLDSPVVGIAPTSTGKGYWEVAADGGVFAFGTAQFYGSMGGKPLNSPVVGIAPTPTGKGYWEVAADGGIFSFGAAAFYGSMGGKPLNSPVVGIAPTPTGKGYWEVAADGGVFAFGDATFYGSMGGQPLNAPVVGTAPVGVTLSA